MNQPSKLHLIDSEQPTRQQVAMARIEQNMREWSKQGWRPVDVAAIRPLVVDDVTGYKVLIDPASPVSVWRRVWRWLTSKAK